MVNKASNATGMRDWLIQRVSAVLMGVYTLFLIAYLAYYQPVYFAQWHHLFSNLGMKAATFIVVLSVLWHAWLGLWTVLTDYVKNAALRLTIEIVVILLLLGYLAWALEILWVVLR